MTNATKNIRNARKTVKSIVTLAVIGSTFVVSVAMAIL